MSDDQYYKRLESLFSETEPVKPEPSQEATPPAASELEALRAHVAELEAAVSDARQQAEREREQQQVASDASQNPSMPSTAPGAAVARQHYPAPQALSWSDNSVEDNPQEADQVGRSGDLPAAALDSESNEVPAARHLVPVWLRNRWGAAAMVAIVYVLLYVVWTYFHWGGEENIPLISDAAFLPLSVFAAAACWRIAFTQKPEARLRRAWLILGLCIFSQFVADFLYLYLEVVLRLPPDRLSPSIADIFYLMFYPLGLWGLMALPVAPLNRSDRFKFVLDLSVVMTVAWMVVWYFIISPTAGASHSSFLSQVMTAAYPIGDVVVLGGIMALLFRRPDAATRSALLIFLTGLLSFVAADLLYAMTGLAGTYSSGGWIDIGWIVAYLLFAFAALRQPHLARGSSTEQRLVRLFDRLSLVLPFVAVGLGYGLVILVSRTGFEIGARLQGLFVGAALLTVFVLTRQLVTLRENSRLNAQLRAASDELRATSKNLEQRVADRTRDLALAAEVGQGLSQMRDLDILLSVAVELIRQRFDLYYTQVYLTDPAGRILVLRSGTGAVGAELVRRSHRLPVGPGSINGTAAAEKRPVIVANTAASGIFRRNPLLPDTRSEMSVPLMVGERVVGVLDLQSARPDALTSDHLPAFQALAGQLAISVENAVLFAQTEQARAEVETQARRLTRRGWEDFLNAVERSERLGYTYDLTTVMPLSEPLPPETASRDRTLATPILVTGEPVGMLQLEGEASRVWTADEAELVKSVARQVAQQVENLRLLAEAERYRAEAEQAARRLTREGWEGYLDTLAAPHAGYTYDLHQVLPLTEADGQGAVALAQPLRVRGETIGKLEVAEAPESLSNETAELVAAVSERLSAHIENLRLAEQTERALAQTEQQAAVLIKRTAELEEATKFLDSVIENLPTMLFVKDAQDLRFVRWNRAGEELLGFSREDMLGKNDYDFFPTEEADFFTAKDRAVLEGGQMLDIPEEPIQTAHQGLRLLHTRKVPVYGADGKPRYLLGISEDITERKQAEETLRRQHAYLTTLQETTLGLIGRLELTDLLQNIITRAGGLMGTEHGYIFLREPDKTEMRMHVGTGTYSGFVDYRLKPGQAVVGTIWQTGEPLVIDDYQAWANRLNLTNLEAVRAVLGVPLKSGSEVVGVIGLAYLEEGRRFGEEEVAVLSRFAQLASVALDNAQLYAEAQQELAERKRTEGVLAKQAAELQTVAQVSTAASTLLKAEDLLQAVVDLTKTSFGLYHAHIYLLDETEAGLALTAGADEIGRQMVAEGRRIPLDQEQSLVARAARTRQGVIVNDVRAAPDFLPNPLLPDTRAEMAVPMIVGNRLLGVFDVQSDVVDYFADEDLRIQATLAAQVAVALQNANLYAEQAATVARLRELDHLKSSFLANMSHELRTPLNSILGFTDVMLEELDGPLTDLMENDLQVIRKNGRHLLNLINDVLDMAKIEAGKLSLIPERFDLQEVLEEVVDITGPLAREKALDLRLETEAFERLDLEADRMRLRQVMINLVNNAIKFTEAGYVTIRAARSDGWIRVMVCDTGLGIPANQLDTIFQEFHQVDSTTTRKAGGTGLGLPISRHLIQMHGGRLWVESTGVPGEGSTFFIELPVESRIKGAEDN